MQIIQIMMKEHYAYIMELINKFSESDTSKQNLIKNVVYAEVENFKIFCENIEWVAPVPTDFYPANVKEENYDS